MKITVAQINPTVGDLGGNTDLIHSALRGGEKEGADIVAVPELSLPGYPPEDLLLKPQFIQDNLKALQGLASLTGDTALIVGFIDQDKSGLYNAAAFIHKKKIKTVYRKMCLPNYGVFDEKRYFQKGKNPGLIEFKGARIGLTICEDIWLGTGPLTPLKKKKPDLVINISASPYHAGKTGERRKAAVEAARFLKAPLLYANLIGGQDELVFDGSSFGVSAAGQLKGRGEFCRTGSYSFDFSLKGKQLLPLFNNAAPQKSIDEIRNALVLGIRDYVQKNRFEKVTLGLSGGIDSALTAALAAEALGPSKVIGVTMPSRFNLPETVGDAKAVAQNLGLTCLEIPIQEINFAFLSALKASFEKTSPNIAEENIQARIRGTLLMALSNKFNWLVLTTGNKSEVSTGYCTIYGDMAGGFSVLKDVLKTTVYALSKRINETAGKEVIPQTTIDRPPTAELRENQKDEDSLGSYDDLDRIVVDYVEKNKSAAEIIRKTGFSREKVKKIVQLIDRNEYKRRQGPPGIKITPRAFGKDHRMPITNRFRPDL